MKSDLLLQILKFCYVEVAGATAACLGSNKHSCTAPERNLPNYYFLRLLILSLRRSFLVLDLPSINKGLQNVLTHTQPWSLWPSSFLSGCFLVLDRLRYTGHTNHSHFYSNLLVTGQNKFVRWLVCVSGLCLPSSCMPIGIATYLFEICDLLYI